MNDHKPPKAKYRIRNWPEYNKAMEKFCLNCWIRLPTRLIRYRQTVLMIHVLVIAKFDDEKHERRFLLVKMPNPGKRMLMVPSILVLTSWSRSIASAWHSGKRTADIIDAAWRKLPCFVSKPYSAINSMRAALIPRWLRHTSAVQH